MCIKKVEAWAFGDKTFDHEIDATKAAIESIIGNPGVAKVIFEKSGDLLPLLDRYATLKRQAAPPKGSGENAEKDPASYTPDEVRNLLAETFRAKAKRDKAGVVQTIKHAGYVDLGDLIERASDMHVKALLALATGGMVGGNTLDAQGHTADCRSRATGYEAGCNCGVLVLDRK